MEDIMRRKFLFCFIGIILFCVSYVNAQMTLPQLQAMYTNYLIEEGFKPSVDSDGDVVFKVEGKTFWIDIDEKDLESFRIVFSNFWEIESLAEKLKVYEVMNYINRTTKVAKVFMSPKEDDVSMDANIFVNKPEDFKFHFARMLDLLFYEIDEFRDKMNE
jgi:lipopolysaccharide export LptBFGC system permease protein LptF